MGQKETELILLLRDEVRVASAQVLTVSWNSAQANRVLLDDIVPTLGISLRNPLSVTIVREEGIIQESRLFVVPGHDDISVVIRDIRGRNYRGPRTTVYVSKWGLDVHSYSGLPEVRKS